MKNVVFALCAAGLLVTLAGCGERDSKPAKKAPTTKKMKKPAPHKEVGHRTMRYAK